MGSETCMTSVDIYCKIHSFKKKIKIEIFVVQVLQSRINNQTITQAKIGAFLDHAMKKVCQKL